MGTSVSQPSPKGSSPGGLEWKAAKESIKDGEQPRQVISKIMMAFEAEHGESTKDVLIDPGVKKVATILLEKVATGQSKNEFLVASFIVEARKQLALTQTNSFFAELALSAGSKAIMEGGQETSKVFAADYASKIIDYVLSRDLPATIGTRGLVNLESLSRLLKSISIEFESRAKLENVSSIVGLLESLLSLPRTGE